MKSEKDFLNEIEKISEEIESCISVYKDLKKKINDVESLMIELKIKKSNLIEDLRILKNKTVDVEISERQKEIYDFKLRLPDLLNKLK